MNGFSANDVTVYTSKFLVTEIFYVRETNLEENLAIW